MTSSWVSSSSTTQLPPLAILQAWVHRPQALARCTISDVYGMRALVKGNEGVEVNVGYSSRDVFMLNRFPCRMVELVGWVAGVDEKEKTQTIYLDDGDGKHVLPVTVRLPLITINTPTPTPTITATRQTQSQTQTQIEHFRPAKERKALRKAALLESQARSQLEAEMKVKGKGKEKEKEYIRKDIRVGDTIRVRGRIDEYRRGDGWCRVVVVEPGNGGVVEVVDPEQQYHHLSKVVDLHQTLYSQPFILPPTSLPEPVTTSAISVVEDETTFGTLDTTMPSSEMTSEISMDSEQVKLCNPSKLRSSQLTDRTFRLYLLDHMSQETTRVVEELIEKGQLEEALKGAFPEYQYLLHNPLVSRAHQSNRTPLRSHSLNSIDNDQDHDHDQDTPKPMKIYTARSIPTIEGFTISSILSISHLKELADLVVEEQSRKEEKRRRRRIRDGMATPKDHSQSLSMSTVGETQGSKSGWRLTKDEKRARMERLVKWVIRGLSEEGVLVQIKIKRSSMVNINTHNAHTSTRSNSQEYFTRRTHVEAYLPLPESLLLPLLIPHISAEMNHRGKFYIARSDPRYGNGILIEEVLKRLRACGEDGRWERVGEFCVENALHFGEGRGLRRVGRGWVVG